MWGVRGSMWGVRGVHCEGFNVGGKGDIQCCCC